MKKLQIRSVRIQILGMPLRATFETSFGSTNSRRLIIVRVDDGEGNSGYGECTAMGRPLYNHETVDSAWFVISGVVVPFLASADVSCASMISGALAPIRGNRMAIAAVETAAWELESIRLGKPLWRHLGGVREEIDCGVSIGLQASADVLIEKVTEAVESGYQRIKIKIAPGRDIGLVAAVRNKFPDIALSVDANAAYDLGKDSDLFLEMDKYDLLMIEQPLAPEALLDHSKLQSRISTPICLDESITCLGDAKQAIELDACRIINIKLGRVGGHTVARAIQEYASDKGVPVWCGGMLETGIGRAHNIAMSTLEGFSLPGDVSASSRYWEQDITEPVVEVSERGTIIAPPGPGTGYAASEETMGKFRVKSETIAL